MPLAFVVIGILAVCSAAVVIVHRNPVYSALALVQTLFLLAVLFVFLEAHLLAALQIIVYAGAIMVLFLFVIMLLNVGEEPREGRRPVFTVTAVVGGLLFAGELVWIVWRVGRGSPESVAVDATFGTTAVLGRRLFTDFLVPFELTSLLLLVAIVGAVVLARRAPEEER